MYEYIQKKIKLKKPDIDEKTLMYFTNYFYVVTSRNVMPDNITIDELIDNVLRMGEIYFFKEDDPIVEEHGTDFKGKRDNKTHKLYVRDSLPEELKEMVIYHEIHHAAQTNEEMLNAEDGPCGINQESNLGRMVMEAQTEWFAEEVYKTIHGEFFEERQIPGEEIRMQKGQTICSALHNYEMYDAFLSKLSIIMNVPKEYFVTLNFMYDNNMGLKKFEEDYEKIRKEKNFKLSFKGLMQILDYIYAVDNICYLKNQNKELVLSGGRTPQNYEIHTDFIMPISQDLQAKHAISFDFNFIQDLVNADDMKSAKAFCRYILNDQFRTQVNDIIEQNMGPNLN